MTEEPALIYQQGEKEQSRGTLAVPELKWAKSAIKASFTKLFFWVHFLERLESLFFLYKENWFQDFKLQVEIF